VRFQILMMERMKKIAFWNIALCSLTEVDKCFRGQYCLHQQGHDILPLAPKLVQNLYACVVQTFTFFPLRGFFSCVLLFIFHLYVCIVCLLVPQPDDRDPWNAQSVSQQIYKIF
jgi:hypothetical protein